MKISKKGNFKQYKRKEKKIKSFFKMPKPRREREKKESSKRKFRFKNLQNWDPADSLEEHTQLTARFLQKFNSITKGCLGDERIERITREVFSGKSNETELLKSLEEMEHLIVLVGKEKRCFSALQMIKNGETDIFNIVSEMFKMERGTCKALEFLEGRMPEFVTVNEQIVVSEYLVDLFNEENTFGKQASSVIMERVEPKDPINDCTRIKIYLN